VPKCDLGWTAQIIEGTKSIGTACPRFECKESPKTLVCSIASGLLSTFDASSIDVDLCDHIIVQQKALWSVSGAKQKDY
jgi:hypothetical protein